MFVDLTTLLIKGRIDTTVSVSYRNYYYYLFLFRSARSIGLRQCLGIPGSCFSFLDPLDIW
jgi:hypothetical protein